MTPRNELADRLEAIPGDSKWTPCRYPVPMGLRDKIITALRAPSLTIPEGYVLVPREPTGEMIKHGSYALSGWVTPAMHSASAYRAMIAAAPPLTIGGVEANPPVPEHIRAEAERQLDEREVEANRPQGAPPEECVANGAACFECGGTVFVGPGRACLACNPELAPPADGAGLSRYDAGLLNDCGGGNVEWWQDYIRAELDRAHDFYATALADAEAQKERQRIERQEDCAALGDEIEALRADCDRIEGRATTAEAKLKLAVEAMEQTRALIVPLRAQDEDRIWRPVRKALKAIADTLSTIKEQTHA